MESDTKSLLAAVAMHSGSNSNPMIQKILAQSGLAPESASNLDIQGLIDKLNEKDPTLAFIAQQLILPKEDRELTEFDDGDTPESNNKDKEEQANTEKIGVAMNRLRQKVEAMFAELEQLRERNDTLAAALGACYLCWGKDPHCEICGGAGSVGFFEIDKDFFEELVIPAMRKIRGSSSLGVIKR